jgi:hypothetical protein
MHTRLWRESQKKTRKTWGNNIKKKSCEERERRERKWGGSEKQYIGRGARNYITVSEGSQAMPTRPSGIGNAYDRN